MVSTVVTPSKAGNQASTLAEVLRKTIKDGVKLSEFESPKKHKAIVLRKTKLSLKTFVENYDYSIVKYTLQQSEHDRQGLIQIIEGNNSLQPAFVQVVQARVPDLDFLPWKISASNSDFDEFQSLLNVGTNLVDGKYNAGQLKELEKNYKDKIPSLKNIVKRIRRFPKFFYYPGLTPNASLHLHSQLAAGSGITISFLNNDFNCGVLVS